MEKFSDFLANLIRVLGGGLSRNYRLINHSFNENNLLKPVVYVMSVRFWSALGRLQVNSSSSEDGETLD